MSNVGMRDYTRVLSEFGWTTDLKSWNNPRYRERIRFRAYRDGRLGWEVIDANREEQADGASPTSLRAYLAFLASTDNDGNGDSTLYAAYLDALKTE